MRRKKVLKLIASCVSAVCIITALSVGIKKTGAYSVYLNGSGKRRLPIYSVSRNDNKIAITFDCAWGTDYTEKILDTLEFYNVKATFFTVSFWAEKNADFLRKIAEKGHEIGTHSKTHSKMSEQNKDTITEELKSSKELIENITGKTVELFRAPFGDYDDLVIETAEELGLFTIQWDVDSLDWKNLSAEKIATRILKKVKGGSIILCHNNGLHTAESLPLVFSELLKQGYEFVTVSDLIYKSDYEMLPDGTQKIKEND